MIKVAGILLASGILLKDNVAMAQTVSIVLETEKNALVLEADEQKRLHNIYLGIKLYQTTVNCQR
jgi:hypothetical protein